MRHVKLKLALKQHSFNIVKLEIMGSSACDVICDITSLIVISVLIVSRACSQVLL
jgi:hypothetical protein